MDKLVQEKINMYEKHVGHDVKHYFKMECLAGTSMTKHTGKEPIDPKLYRLIIGKFMNLLVTKLFIQGSNASACEVTKHFLNPGRE